MSIELRHLRYFIAVADKLNFTEAARSLHIAQPSLSLQIQDLERLIAVSLIQRNNRSVKLTPAGEVFLVEARQLLKQADLAVANTLKANRGEIGELCIGFIYVAAKGFLPSVLNQFHQQYPDVMVNIKHMSNVEQIDALQNNQIDVGFTRVFNTNAYADLLVDCVTQDTLMVAVPENHPLASQSSFLPEQFKDYPIVPYARAESPLLFQQVWEQFGPATFTPHKVIEPYMLDTALMLVEAGFGITIVPGCARFIYPKGVKFLPLDFPTNALNLYLVRRKDSIGNPNIDAFVKLVKSEASLKA